MLNTTGALPSAIDSIWISNREASRLMGSHHRKTVRMASAGFISTSESDGGRPRYRLGDVLRISMGIVRPSI